MAVKQSNIFRLLQCYAGFHEWKISSKEPLGTWCCMHCNSIGRLTHQLDIEFKTWGLKQDDKSEILQ